MRRSCLPFYCFVWYYLCGWEKFLCPFWYLFIFCIFKQRVGVYWRKRNNSESEYPITVREIFLGRKAWTLIISFCSWISISLETWVVIGIKRRFYPPMSKFLYIFFGIEKSLSIWFPSSFGCMGKLSLGNDIWGDMYHFSMIMFSWWHSTLQLSLSLLTRLCRQILIWMSNDKSSHGKQQPLRVIWT